jgi:hypothetical protein
MDANNPRSRKGLTHVWAKVDFDKIFKARVGGDFKVLNIEPSVNGHKMVRVKFFYTSKEKVVRWTDVNNGKEFSNIRDDYYPTVAGVGCIGNGSSYDKHYGLWEGMIVRCYDASDHTYARYGAKGVKVCDRWHCFEYFLEDVVNLPNYDLWAKYGGKCYNLDKDFLQQGVPLSQKIYSPNTCMFISTRDNTLLAVSNNRNNYIGVRKYGNYFEAYMSIGSFRKSLGKFATAELAAAAYNAAAEFYFKNSIVILNKVPPIPPGEINKYRLNINKDMFTII